MASVDLKGAFYSILLYGNRQKKLHVCQMIVDLEYLQKFQK